MPALRKDKEERRQIHHPALLMAALLERSMKPNRGVVKRGFNITSKVLHPWQVSAVARMRTAQSGLGL
jgi:hypothetical protein